MCLGFKPTQASLVVENKKLKEALDRSQIHTKIMMNSYYNLKKLHGYPSQEQMQKTFSDEINNILSAKGGINEES